MQGKRRRVLLVCMANSVHVARWVLMFRNEDIDFYLFPSTQAGFLHESLLPLTKSKRVNGASVELRKFDRLTLLVLYLIDRFLDNRLRGVLLKKFASQVNPDFVHVLEMQHAGYLSLRGFERKLSCPLIVTNYGSDIYWFQRFSRHRKKISALLEMSDFYSAECSRDVELARSHGFAGVVLPVLPNSGGINADEMGRPDSIELLKRDLILVKGYHGWAGRAVVALRALISIRKHLRGYRIVFFSTSFVVKILASISPIRRMTTCLPKGAKSHEEMLALMGQARIYLGLSKTDGISTSAIEALSQGAFPIQTSTSCLSEWVQDGLTGKLISSTTAAEVQTSIISALEYTGRISQDNWEQNLRPIWKRLDSRELKKQALTFYTSNARKNAKAH
jgi:hypothetical protein